MGCAIELEVHCGMMAFKKSHHNLELERFIFLTRWSVTILSRISESSMYLGCTQITQQNTGTQRLFIIVRCFHIIESVVPHTSEKSHFFMQHWGERNQTVISCVASFVLQDQIFRWFSDFHKIGKSSEKNFRRFSDLKSEKKTFGLHWSNNNHYEILRNRKPSIVTGFRDFLP